MYLWVVQEVDELLRDDIFDDLIDEVLPFEWVVVDEVELI
jgi:hypothetical protein